MLRRMVRPGSTRPAAAQRRRWVSEPCRVRAGAFGFRDPVDGGLALLPGLDDLLLQRQQRLQMALERLGQVAQDPGQPAAQPGRVGFVAVGVGVAELAVQPAQQRLLFGDGQFGVDRGRLPRCRRQAARGGGPVQPGGLQLNPVGVVAGRGPVPGEHDLVGQRGQVDPVRLLVQVVALGQVLLPEVVPDGRRLAVLVALLRGLAGLLGQRERLHVAGVDEIVVAVSVSLARAVPAHPHQREERLEDLLEDRFVAVVLDQRHPQRLAQQRLGGQHAGRGRARHGVERLGDRHPDAAEAQQPHEPVQGRLHRRRP